MKLNLRNFQKSITFLLVFFMVVSNAQNAIVGTGFAGSWPGACNSVSGATYLSANISNTFGSTGLIPNGTGNQYWRLGIDWSGSIYQINNGGTTDALVAPNTTYNAAVTCQGSGALYYNVPNASYRYVFKTLNGGVSPTGTWVFFEVQGAVQNVSSVSASPSAAPPVNMPVTVTATTSGALSTGQAVYLRYTTNAWSTSTVVPMTGSGTTYNATIPGFTAGTNVSYYVFTSAPTNVATNGSNADLYTMTWNAGAVNGGSNYSYTVSATTANVWVTSTGGTGAAGAGYATLSAAFTAINGGTHTGVINVTILANTTEPATAVPLVRSGSGSASYTSVRIVPSGDRIINSAASPTASRGIIELNGADNVTIDGDDPSTTGVRNLTIQSVTSTSTGIACIRLSSTSTTGTDGADNITIKNCIIIGSRSSATSTVVNYGIAMSNSSAITTGAYSSLNTIIDNNVITRCYHGVFANGTSATYPNTGLQILNNTIGTPASGTFADATTVGSRGILLTYTAATSGGAIIRGNDIRVGVSATGYGQTIAGIEVGTVNYGFVIDKNNIHDIVQPSTAGWGAHGIYITGSGNNTLSTISNNFIRDVKMVVYQATATGSYWIPGGITFSAGATGVNIVNNTIVMGAQLGSGSNFSSFGVNASVAGVRIAKFLNNNIVNTHSSTWAFGLYCSANLNISGGTVNNNNYYVPNTGHVGYYNGANRTALSDWQTATSKDANSYSVNPSFVSATDLHLNTTGNSNFESTGAVVGTSGVSDDYDGQTRPGPTGSVNGGGTAPDIGADEFDGVPLILCTTPSAQPTAFTAGVITQTTVAGSFTIATGSPSGYLVVRSPGALSANPVDGTNYAAGATLGNGTVIQSGSTLSFAPTGLTSNTAYTITIFSFNGGSCSGGPLYLTTSPLTGTLTTCAATPTLPTATSITTTGATIGWTASAAGGGAGTISYTVNVFTDPARTTHAPNSPYASTTSVSQVVTGLSAATTYYYRIVASNGSCNSGNLDGSFTTACANSSLTLNEGFNTSGTAVFPICWTQQTVVGTSNITFQTSSTNPTTTPQEGTRFVYWNSFNITSGNETRLVSPPITTTGTASVDVDFQWFHDNTAYTTAGYSDEGVFVEYSLDGTTWITVGSQITRLGGTNGWNLKTVTLPAGAGNQATIYVGFRFRSKLGNNCALDAVSIKPSPTCADNTVAATTAIGSTTATINWTASASAPANGYEWEVRSSGNGGTGFTGLAASGVVAAGVLTENVTGLAANTAYTVWVRANCGAGGYSQWVSGGVFTTTQVPATIPYLDDFSSNNYSFVNGSQTNKWFYGAVTGNPANAIYVSSDASGTTNDYNVNATSVVHSYRDIAIPSGTTTSVFSFDWKANAEACCDYVRVWLVPTSFIPTAGTQITTGSGRIQVGGNLNAQTAWQTYSNAALDVSSFAGATMRLIFEWRNDGSLGSQNAAAIDNVSLDLPCAATVTSATATAICGSGSVTIVAAGSLGTTELRLYTTSTGGVSIDTEMSASGNLITPSISTTTIFYVAAFNGTCETSPRVAVTATINPTPNDITIQSTINGVDACNQNYVELSITGNSAVAVFEEGFETNPVTKFNLQASGSGEFYDEPYFTEGSSAISLVGAGDIDFSNGNTRITLANSIDLSQYASATLTFDHICASEATYDFGYVQYSLDGGTSWTSFPTTAYSGTGTLKNGVVSFDKSSYTDWNTQFTSSASSPGTAPATSLFKSETLNLNSFITNTNFRIRFRLAYDDFTDYYGWIIDNVKINVVPKITWSPNTGLYTDSALTTAYAGTPATVVYAMPIGSETYTAAVALGTCNKTDTEVVVNNTKRYVGANGGDWNIAASWFPVGIPTIDDCVRIAADKSVVVPATVTALANTLTLESNTALFSTVGDAVLKLNNALVNLGAGSNVTFANNSSLVQINDVNNIGNITYNRTSPLSVIWSDYVYWSSPVSGQTVASGNNYYWNNAAGTSGNWEAASGATMYEGKGFIFRGIGTKSFVGVPYNGDVTVDVYRRDIVGLNDNWNLIGNPYPSAISADEFIADTDNTSIEGSVALWTHGSAPSSAVTSPFYGSFTYNYNPNDYIIYNSFASQSGPSTFDGNIAAGQAFFVKMNDGATATSGTVKFKNSMRTDGSNNAYNNSQFYRSTQAISNIESIEKHRIWLDIVDTNMLSYRTTIGYATNATDLKDRLYDAYTAVTPTMMSTYSLLGDDKLAIKANALPFDENDEFAIGYNVPLAGAYSIAIHAVDGLFEDQEIYLEDLELNIVHNLKNSPYSFTTTQGEINSRFKIIFTNQTLGNPNFDFDNSVVVANNDDLKVFSNFENIESIVVYDLLGRTIFTRENVNAKQFVVPVEKAHAPLIMKIKLANGIVVERKTIF